jgi:hypothetical protein
MLGGIAPNLGGSPTRTLFVDQSLLKVLALFFRDVTDEPEKPGN